MRYEMRMPDLATTGGEIRVVRWLAAPGEPVRRGEPLLEVETDKSTMEVEATVSGTLEAVLAGPDAEVAAGEVVAWLQLPEPAGAAPPAAPATAPPAAAPRQAPAGPPAEPEWRPEASPIAATAAGERRTSFFAANRRRRDAAAAPVLTAAQRVAARRLAASKATAPHFYLLASADAAEISRRRAASTPPLAWDVLFARAAARALRRFPRLACRYDPAGEGSLVPSPTGDIGIAVDLDGDLYVLPLRSPAERDLAELSAELRAGVERLRAGDAATRRGGPCALTVSNLGGSGVEAFLAVLNPPEAVILAVGRVGDTVVAENGVPVVRRRVTLGLSVDHRVANGREAAAFLAAVTAELERPAGEEER